MEIEVSQIDQLIRGWWVKKVCDEIVAAGKLIAAATRAADAGGGRATLAYNSDLLNYKYSHKQTTLDEY